VERVFSWLRVGVWRLLQPIGIYVGSDHVRDRWRRRLVTAMPLVMAGATLLVRADPATHVILFITVAEFFQPPLSPDPPSR